MIKVGDRLFFSIPLIRPLIFFIYWITDLLAEKPCGRDSNKNINKIGKNLSDDLFLEKPKKCV